MNRELAEFLFVLPITVADTAKKLSFDGAEGICWTDYTTLLNIKYFYYHTVLLKYNMYK